MAAARVERRLAAIMAADVAGYSRLMERDEAGTLARLKAIRKQLVEPVLARHGGRFVDLKGDGAIVEFSSVVAAVEAAVEIQRAMADHEADRPEQDRIRYRIGINLGDVVVDGPDIYGDGINVAARIEALCEPGGVWVAARVYDPVRGKLDVPFEPTGRHRVKNISEPVETWRVRIEGGPARRALPAWLRVRWWPATAAAAVIGLLTAGAAWWLWPQEALSARLSIAVLPFDNLSGDAATGRLADGITEDTITDLARFRALDVIARNSTEVHKGKAVDVREIGRELDVGYVLEGSIQRDSERVRITAQLIDTDSGAHLWSERWDRPLQDVFAVQTELAEQVSYKIGSFYSGLLASAGHELAKRKRPDDLTAYDLFLLGTQANQRMTKESAEEAIRLFRQSLAIDPSFARAWSELFWSYTQLMGFVEATDDIWKARADAARRAVELDPEDGEARATLAIIYMDEGDLLRGEAEFSRALRTNPGSADLLAIYSRWASSFGKPNEGIEAAERARRLNPNTPAWAFMNFRTAYFMAGRYEDALRMHEHIPKNSLTNEDYFLRAASLAALGRMEEAHAAVAETLAHYPQVTVEWGAWWIGYSDADWDRVVETMTKAGFPRCASAADVKEMWNLTRLPECTAS